MIQDSGNRRDFETGAVRDIADGKGRCDLLPLDVVSSLLSDGVLKEINRYEKSGECAFIIMALKEFCIQREWSLPNAVIEVSKHYEDGCKKYGERNWEKGIPLHCYIDSGIRHYLKWLRGDQDERHDRAFIWNMIGAIWTQNHRPEMIDLEFEKKYVGSK